MLHLERPLVFLDLEATGTNPQSARIFQAALQRFVPSREGATLADSINLLVDPECEIPASVAQLTGISTADVAGKPCFMERIPRLAGLLDDADIAGYNAIAYDVPLLEAEFERAGEALPGPTDRVILDPYRLEQALRPRTLSALYERYVGATLEDAHDAMADVEAAGCILQKQLEEHGLSGTPAQLAERIRGEYLDDGRKLKQDGEAIRLCFGKHEGKTLQEIQTEHPGYLDWMYRTIDELRPHLDEVLEQSSL